MSDDPTRPDAAPDASPPTSGEAEAATTGEPGDRDAAAGGGRAGRARRAGEATGAAPGAGNGSPTERAGRSGDGPSGSGGPRAEASGSGTSGSGPGGTAGGDPAGPEPGDRSDGDGPDIDADLQAAADAVEVDLELLLNERAQYLDAYRRAQADFENYRKQVQKRQEDAVVRALGRFVEGLLPVLDSCDAALAHGANEVEPVLTALYGALSKEGLERIDPKGAEFDPAEAEAVVHEPGEGGQQVVAEVLRPGYRWRGQVLRPAMVKVTD